MVLYRQKKKFQLCKAYIRYQQLLGKIIKAASSKSMFNTNHWKSAGY